MKPLFFFLSIVLFLNACTDQPIKVDVNGKSSTLSTDEYLKIAADAYLYAYPLVLMDYTRQVGINVIEPHPIIPRAPINQLNHFRRFPDHTLTAVVKPNVDTYYSVAWLDLSAEPQLFHMPATDRYYLIPFYDSFTNVFTSPGTRTHGNQALDLMITGPNWKGQLLDGYELIKSPTNMVWALGRIQTNSDEDGSTIVKNIQDGMSIIPLSALDNPNYQPPKGTHSEEIAKIIPVKEVEKLDIESFLNKAADILENNPPLQNDKKIIAQMEKIGLVPGQPFSISTDNFILNQKLKAIPRIVHKRFRERRSNPDPTRVVNGWMMTTEGLGSYDTSYASRAYIDFIALGVNLPEDAIYPNATADINGDPLDGSKSYVIHIDSTHLPPVKAFWSLTAYNEDEFLIKNELNRYALSNRNKLNYNKDGSLDIFIQAKKPSQDKIDNWLPIVDKGPFSLTLRLYWPEVSVLNRKWIPPSIVPLKI